MLVPQSVASWKAPTCLSTGEGLPAQTDDTAHARQRALLNPAFRADYLRNLIPSFARQGFHMADLLASSNGTPVDVQARDCPLFEQTARMTPHMLTVGSSFVTSLIFSFCRLLFLALHSEMYPTL